MDSCSVTSCGQRCATSCSAPSLMPPKDKSMVICEARCSRTSASQAQLIDASFAIVRHGPTAATKPDDASSASSSAGVGSIAPPIWGRCGTGAHMFRCHVTAALDYLTGVREGASMILALCVRAAVCKDFAYTLSTCGLLPPAPLFSLHSMASKEMYFDSGITFFIHGARAGEQRAVTVVQPQNGSALPRTQRRRAH